MKQIVFVALIFFCFLSKLASAQPEHCINNGYPWGYGIICVNPWQPQPLAEFQINFSSTSCTQQTNHEYHVIRDGQNFNIYMVYGVGGCPGVPQSPLRFSTQQSGVMAGNYTANLYRLTVPSWPPPSFDPDDYTLIQSVNFVVLGTAAETESVPLLGKVTLPALIALLLTIGIVSLRLHRRTR